MEIPNACARASSSDRSPSAINCADQSLFAAIITMSGPMPAGSPVVRITQGAWEEGAIYSNLLLMGYVCLRKFCRWCSVNLAHICGVVTVVVPAPSRFERSHLAIAKHFSGLVQFRLTEVDKMSTVLVADLSAALNYLMSTKASSRILRSQASSSS